jgi:uncharacterized protein
LAEAQIECDNQLMPPPANSETVPLNSDSFTESEAGGRLIEFMRPLRRCAVAFSGGVDSAVVAYAANAALGDDAVAVTGVGPSLAQSELEIARQVAAHIGIRHRLVETNESELPEYQRNDGRRCFHCKATLYDAMLRQRSELGFDVIVSGTNRDDLGDFRPGLDAAAERDVRHPLAECGLDKSWVRRLARFWGLHVWDKPAAPCLASRIAYGVAATPERLARIEAAEGFLKSLGFIDLRVRVHQDELARIEVAVGDVARLCAEPIRSRVASQLRKLGFRFVSVDLMGLQPGGLNTLLLPAAKLAERIFE